MYIYVSSMFYASWTNWVGVRVRVVLMIIGEQVHVYLFCVWKFIIDRDAVMTESFGDGYSTRSNEEGFGGIYGGSEEEGGHKVHGTPAGIYIYIFFKLDLY